MVRLKRSDNCEEGAPAWVTTFGDMMSLLLTFFIMLAAMSEIKKEDDFNAMAEAFRQRFGKHVSLDDLAIYSKPTVAKHTKAVSDTREKTTKNRKGASKTEGPLGKDERIKTIRPADDPMTGGIIPFPEGSDLLAPATEDRLKRIVTIIAGKPQKIEIRGHTSARPLPPDSPYKNHFELAYARCHALMDKLVEMGIDPRRIRISIAGPYEPLHIDPDPEKRKRNARVEVFLLNELTQDLQGTSEEQAERVAPLSDD